MAQLFFTGLSKTNKRIFDFFHRVNKKYFFALALNFVLLIFSFFYARYFLPQLDEKYGSLGLILWQQYWILQSSISLATFGSVAYLSNLFIGITDLRKRTRIFSGVVLPSLLFGIVFYIAWFFLVRSFFDQKLPLWVLCAVLIRMPFTLFSPYAFADTEQFLLRFHDSMFVVFSCLSSFLLFYIENFSIYTFLIFHLFLSILLSVLVSIKFNFFRYLKILLKTPLRLNFLVQGVKSHSLYFTLSFSAMMLPFVEVFFASGLSYKEFYLQSTLQRFAFVFSAVFSFAGWLMLKSNINKIKSGNHNSNLPITVSKMLFLLFLFFCLIFISTYFLFPEINLILLCGFCCNVIAVSLLALFGQAFFADSANSRRLALIACMQLSFVILITVFGLPSLDFFYILSAIFNIFLVCFLLKNRFQKKNF